jgi:molybdopterin synthase catalytic subunit
MIDIQLSESALDLHFISDMVSGTETGGTCFFVGTIRNQTKGRKVEYLEFEAYPPMAVSEMKKIAERIKGDFDAHAVVIHHRVGKLIPGEAAVIIGVATPHREAAFSGCKQAIDVLKETVPIWKKEVFTDGEVWVAAHP